MSLSARWALVFLCAISLVHGRQATAQSQQTPPQKENVKIGISADGILTMDFADGRQAKVLTAATRFRSIPITLNMTENMCAPEHGRPACRLITRVGLARRVLVWTQHPDNSKLGFPVGFSGSGANVGQVFEEFANLTQANGTEDLFICDDYRWMNPQAPSATEINRHEVILSWGAEGNFENSETKVNENMTISGAFNLQLSGRFGRMYQITGAQFITLFENGLPLIGAGPSTIAIRHKVSHEICQVQFSPDTSKAVKISQELFGELQKLRLGPLVLDEATLRRIAANIMIYADLSGKFE